MNFHASTPCRCLSLFILYQFDSLSTLVPAFDNILPALFGGLGVVYISKNWKLSIVPLVFMVVLFLAFPFLSGSVGVLVPVGVLIALGAARIMYKKGWV